ncbi:MAG: NUDIX domain-containing protein [Actinobacteria bacterium]|nr:NUDIX domain-containing protein [Actinomycetota bacterium]
MTYTDRVLAYVTREREGRKELLVFDHRDYPSAGTQVPAGRLEPGEELEAGLLRELEEESGLANAHVTHQFGTFAPRELLHGRRYTNHAFELEAPGAPDTGSTSLPGTETTPGSCSSTGGCRWHLRPSSGADRTRCWLGFRARASRPASRPPRPRRARS